MKAGLVRVLGLVVACCHGGLLNAQDTNPWGVGSVNLDHLQTFWRAVEQSNGPVTVLAFGDSMSVSYRSAATSLFQELRARLGSAGTGYTDGYDYITPSLAGGASWVEGATTNWWARHWYLPAGGSIVWTNRDFGSGAVLCDQIGVYWVAQPTGGRFALSVSTNRGPWSTPLALLEGYALAPVGRFTNLSVARLPYWLRVEGVGGNNVILAPQFLDTTSAGIHTAWMAQSGVNLNTIFSVSTNVTYPILSALNPQLVLWHMKEFGDLGEIVLSNRLHDLESQWRACVTRGDVVYVGTPYDIRDASTNYTPRETRLIREAAMRNHRAYVDCMSPCVSYSWMVAQGYMNDAYHPSAAGCAYLADILWRELGFFALRADRRLNFKSAGELMWLEWFASTNVAYEVQTSTNLVDWGSQQTLSGLGKPQAWTNSPAGAPRLFFRLRLAAD